MAKKSKSSALPFFITKTQRNCFKVNMPVDGYPKGWEQWFLLTSDQHWDNPKSDHALQLKHLNQALERNAGIVCCGDFFCAMQGRWDPRSDRADVRDMHNVTNYLDALVNTAADFLEPFSKNFIFIGRGNHETSILKRQETDLIERLVSILNFRTGSHIYNGGYSGWVRFVLTAAKTQRTLGRSMVMHYHHGYGGSAPVTKGTIHSNRKSVYLPDANLVVSGHIHESWRLDLVRQRFSTQGRTYQDEQTHVSIPTYKEEYIDGYGGWHVERGAAPKPIGAVWLRLFVPEVFRGKDKQILFEITRAK